MRRIIDTHLLGWGYAVNIQTEKGNRKRQGAQRSKTLFSLKPFDKVCYGVENESQRLSPVRKHGIAEADKLVIFLSVFVDKAVNWTLA